MDIAIYILTDDLGIIRYVGQTGNPQRRWERHKWRTDFRVAGMVIVATVCKDSADEEERRWMQLFGVDNLMNLTKGGEPSGWTHGPIARRNMSESKRRLYAKDPAFKMALIERSKRLAADMAVNEKRRLSCAIAQVKRILTPEQRERMIAGSQKGGAIMRLRFLNQPTFTGRFTMQFQFQGQEYNVHTGSGKVMREGRFVAKAIADQVLEAVKSNGGGVVPAKKAPKAPKPVSIGKALEAGQTVTAKAPKADKVAKQAAKEVGAALTPPAETAAAKKPKAPKKPKQPKAVQPETAEEVQAETPAA